MATEIKIQTITVGAGGQSAIDFTNIPQTYSHLKLVVSARTNRSTAIQDAFVIRFNGDTTGGNYTGRRLYGTGSAVSWDSEGFVYGSGNSGTSNVFSNSELFITNYSGSAKKAWNAESVLENNNASVGYQFLDGGQWNNTAAITRITLTPDIGTSILEGSMFTLYGIKNYDLTMQEVASATGGVITATDTYIYHAFLASGTFTPTKSLTCDIMVIAGGGSGASGQTSQGYNAGGGGAGGVVGFTSQSLSATPYTVTVGAGGATVTGGATRGNSGSNSTFGALTAAVGGGGGGGGNAGGLTGGSGGGSYLDYAGGAGTSGQGFAGGQPQGGFAYGGGGGGGAGGLGGNAGISGSSWGGTGGVGTTAYSAWGIATGTGHNVSGTRYFAGGGGGGDSSQSGGIAGNGGGGLGAIEATRVATAGTANTGGGGGGGVGQSTANRFYGAAGGSGIVIVRYPR